jgi:hypothetical protein
MPRRKLNALEKKVVEKSAADITEAFVEFGTLASSWRLLQRRRSDGESFGGLYSARVLPPSRP